MSGLRAYQGVATGSSTDALVVRHAELVKRIAYHLAGRLPASVEVSDLIQAGMLGLLEAASNYTADRGASFETYAGIRIRGAMLDGLRKLDWAPRSVHRKARAAAAAVRELEAEFGREARDNEIAERMGVSLEDYHRIAQDAASCRVTSLDDSSGDEESLLGRVEDEGADPFLDATELCFQLTHRRRSSSRLAMDRARRPVELAKRIEHRATDADARIRFKTRPAIRRVVGCGFQQAEHAGLNQIGHFHGRRQPPRQVVSDALHQLSVTNHQCVGVVGRSGALISAQPAHRTTSRRT